MILYNVTYGIDKEIETSWVSWMKEVYIPSVLKAGVFAGHKFYKVLSHDDDGSSSYCVQYFIPTILLFNHYLETYAPAHMAELRERYKDRHVAFNTLLEEVD